MKVEALIHKRKQHRRESIAGRIALAGLALAGSVLFVRALPDLVRYLRIERM
jgi:hypothetical protein